MKSDQQSAGLERVKQRYVEGEIGDDELEREIERCLIREETKNEPAVFFSEHFARVFTDGRARAEP